MTSTRATLALSIHDPRALTPPLRRELALLLAADFAHTNPTDPPLVLEATEAQIGADHGEERGLLVLAREGDTLLGVARLDYHLVQNTDQADLRVAVHPQRRRRGTGRGLAARVARELLALGRARYTTSTSSRSPAGEAFAAALGARTALPMVISDLPLAGLDEALLTRWTARPEGDPYRLHVFTHIPDEELERVARVLEVMNTAPRGELEFDDWAVSPGEVASWQAANEAGGKRSLLLVAEDSNTGEFVAFSELSWHPLRAALVDQQGTGVRPDHRGQGLGQWLKAQNLLELRRENPQATYVRTGNADSNAAMLGINRALGFAPVYSRQSWQGETAELLRRAEVGSRE